MEASDFQKIVVWRIVEIR